MRFHELRRLLPVIPSVPPRLDDELTALGLVDWALSHQPEMDEARSRFDAT